MLLGGHEGSAVTQHETGQPSADAAVARPRRAAQPRLGPAVVVRLPSAFRARNRQATPRPAGPRQEQAGRRRRVPSRRGAKRGPPQSAATGSLLSCNRVSAPAPPCSALRCLQCAFPSCIASARPTPPHMQPVWPAPHTAATSREAGPLQDLQRARNTGLKGLFSARKAAGGAGDAGSLPRAPHVDQPSTGYQDC